MYTWKYKCSKSIYGTINSLTLYFLKVILLTFYPNNPSPLKSTLKMLMFAHPG